MKTLFGIAAILAVAGVSMVAVDSAEARGPRGAGNISTSNIQVGPRVTAPVINPNRVGPQARPPRQIAGPRENGRGFNCSVVGGQTRTVHRVRTSEYVTRTYGGTVRCPQRY